MGWKSIRPPTRGWPGFRLPSETGRSNSVNRAQTFESGFASFLAVSAASPASGAVTPSPGSTRASCPRAPVVKKTKASSSAAGTTGCRPTLARRIVVCSFVLISVTSPVLFLSIALPMWDAAAFELSIFTSPKMLVAASRFDRPAHLRNDNLARLAGHRLPSPNRSPHQFTRSVRKSSRMSSSIPPVHKQSALQSSAAPKCLVFLLFLRCAQKLAKAIADSRRSTADRGRFCDDLEICLIEKSCHAPV